MARSVSTSTATGLVTSETLIDENPDVVEKFVRATYQGYAFVLENPEEATRIVLEHYPILDPEVTRQQINELSGLITGTETATLGWLEEDKVARTLKLVSEAYELEASLSPLELYTTEFFAIANHGRKPMFKPTPKKLGPYRADGSG